MTNRKGHLQLTAHVLAFRRLLQQAAKNDDKNYSETTRGVQRPTSEEIVSVIYFSYTLDALLARDLRIYIDADVSMRAHVKRTVSPCFAALRQMIQIRRAVPTATFQMLVVALDYGTLTT